MERLAMLEEKRTALIGEIEAIEAELSAMRDGPNPRYYPELARRKQDLLHAKRSAVLRLNACKAELMPLRDAAWRQTHPERGTA